MKWRYGIVKYQPKDRGYEVYGIGELYYDTDPLQVFACTEEPVEPYADPDEEDPTAAITKQLQMMLNDIAKYPVFDSAGPFAPEPPRAHDWGDEDDWICEGTPKLCLTCNGQCCVNKHGSPAEHGAALALHSCTDCTDGNYKV